jgi:nitrous oxidase accessory protein
MSKSAALLLALVLVVSGAVLFLPVNAESSIVVSPNESWLTLSNALRLASEGTTIFLKKGTYEIVEDPLKITKAVSIVGEDQAGTILVFPPDTRTGYASIPYKTGFHVLVENFSISNLTITNCDYGISANADGLQVSHVTTSRIYVRGSHCKISENRLTAGGRADSTVIDVTGAFNEIAYNDIKDVKCGGTFNSVIGNRGIQSEIEVTGYSNFVAENHVTGISLSSSSLTTVYKNSLSRISLQNCDNNTVCGNIVRGHLKWGIEMGSVLGNVFYGNNITDYTRISVNDVYYGYGVFSESGVAKENLFYHNNFVNNYRDVDSSGPLLGSANYWDNGVEGNYWDDYSGVDSDGDGIGDTEYEIRKWDPSTYGPVETVFGKDNHPLMAPFNINSVTVALPEWMYPLSLQVMSPENATYPLSANVSLNFTVNKQTSWIRYSLDGQDNVTATGNITLSGLPVGLHNITIYAEDLFGNNATSEPIYFTIAEPEPTPEPFPAVLIAVAASATVVAVVSAGLLLYLRRKNRSHLS